MLRHPFNIFLLAALLITLPPSAKAQNQAQLPYAMVSSYHELFKSLEHLEQIIPSMVITSVDPAVPPPEIEFKIKTAQGWVSFNPDENGEIRFPDKPDWTQLTLISNQPKGTLQLAIGYAARPLESTEVSYQELMGLVSQFDEAMSALARETGQNVQAVKGLTIQFPEGSAAAINVISPKSRRPLKSNGAGVVIMRYDDALWAENPAVKFDELPVGIIPLQ